MPPRSRYAVDPSLSGPAPTQSYQQQQPYPPSTSTQEPQLHNVSERRSPAPSGPYAPTQQHHQHSAYQQHTAIAPQQQQQQQQQQQHPQQQHQPQHAQGPNPFHPPQNHIPPPPHSAGPSLSGPRVRIDPTQMPNPIEAQEMDQNLWDDEDFMSCHTKGVIPLAGTDWRGVDQGNSLPRHLRATLPVIPSNSQLLDTTALPFGLLIQPFAPLRYDEAPVPVVSNFTAGGSAFDPPTFGEEEEGGPPRCASCRGYINPWVRWQDGGRKWACNLCGTTNPVPETYFSHLSANGQRMDHETRPELQHGTVDFLVPKIYWAPQPPTTGSLLDNAVDNTTDALASTAQDLLSGLQSAVGDKSRGPSPMPNAREKEKERVKKEKRLRKPAGLGRVFVLDVSSGSVARGVLREVCEGIRTAIYSKRRETNGGGSSGQEVEEEEEDGLGAGEKIAIVTVAESVGFWNLSSTAASPSLMVVSDLEDMFVPLHSGFLIDPVESRANVEKLLDTLPTLMENQPDGNRVAAGSAIKGALAGLRMLGGQITLFLSALPIVGLGRLTPRDDPTVYNTDKEKALFTAANPFWRIVSDELAESGVGVNVFFFPDQYTDVASIGTLASTTGGELFFHPKFNPVRDRDTLFDEIKRVLTRETAYNATIRIRCSNGLRVAEHIGNFYQRSLTDLEVGTIDDAKTIAAVLRHEARLDDRAPAYVQVAVLYTSSTGERRVRCLNMSFTVTSLIGNVFRFADLDGAVTLFMKEAISQMGNKPLRDTRKNLTDKSNRLLLMYRRHCAPAVQAGQLILPEGFKLLPLYTLCMLKSKPLKGGNVASDVRAHYMRNFRSMSVVATMMMLYPRLLAIHDLADDVGFPASNGRLKTGRFMRASYNWMVSDGAYLMVNGEIAMIWFGSAVSPQIIDDLYGVESAEELDIRMTRLPKLPTLLSTQVRNILTHLEGIVGHGLPVILVRQNVDGMEIEFANALVEDSNNDALSYADYLMTAHKSITNELSGNGSSGGWFGRS